MLSATVAKSQTMKQSIHQFKVTDLYGNEFDFSSLKGKKIIVVNTASECGLTPQYEQLQAVYEKYKDQNFVIVGFPANNFGGQEPGSNEEIKTFCSTKYNVTFPIFSKISVKGSDKHPFYRFLTEKSTNPDSAAEVAWNFNKFLVDKNGKVVAKYDSGVAPESAELTGAIEKALQ